MSNHITRDNDHSRRSNANNKRQLVVTTLPNSGGKKNASVVKTNDVVRLTVVPSADGNGRQSTLVTNRPHQQAVEHKQQHDQQPPPPQYWTLPLRPGSPARHRDHTRPTGAKKSHAIAVEVVGADRFPQNNSVSFDEDAAVSRVKKPHKESSHQVIVSNGHRIQRPKSRTVTQDAEFNDYAVNQQSPSTLWTDESSPGSLMSAESEMDKYFSEERRGNLHEALMSINKAIYIYHQVLTAGGTKAATADDRIRVRIKYNAAMLKLRRLVQLMTSDHPTENMTSSNHHTVRHQHHPTVSTLDTHDAGRRKDYFVINASTTDRKRDTVRTGGHSVSDLDQRRTVDTYATLPRKDGVARREMEHRKQFSGRSRITSVERYPRLAELPTLNESHDVISRRYNSLPRMSAGRHRHSTNAIVVHASPRF